MNKSDCNNIMADRLNKLCEYLNNENYDLAIQVHKNSNQSVANLDESYQLKLAKAYYFSSNDYRQAIQILNKIKDSKYLEIYYEARMLHVKACYLSGFNPQEFMRYLQELRAKIAVEFKDNIYLLTFYLACIKEVEEVISTPIKGRDPSRSSLADDERKQFQKLLREQDDNSIIMEGMPKFLVSTKWYEAWKEYTSVQKIQRQKKHPGPITQFQLLDHPFRVFYDKVLGKDYTNKYIFNGPGFEIFPKKCWLFLKQKYGGFELKRFNISFIDKPYEIMTETYLKKIEIAKVEKDKPNQAPCFVYVQITKKESWSGLKNKLAPIWGPGQIYEFEDKRNNSPVNDAEIFQEVDTIGKRYVYMQVQQKNKELNGKKIQKCGNKNCQQTEKLMFCKCKSIKYCGLECLKADYKNHRKKCELEQAHIKQQSVIFKNFNLQEKDFGGMKGKVGLKNLGNTCYMNSGLQCLSNTKELTEYFMKDEFKNHINYSNPLGTKGNLACTYAQLVREIWTGSSDSVSPFKLKKIIGNFATQFSGFGQQDSQEFISYLIDGLSQDLNLVKKKQTFETGDNIKPDEEMSRESELNYAKRIQSYVRNLMVGQFKSTVVCSSCKKISVCFDPYLLISLPIPTNDEWDFFFVPTELNRGAIKFPMEYSRSTTLEKVTKELVSKYNKVLDSSRENKQRQKLSPDKLQYLLLDGDKFQILKLLEGNENIASIRGKYILFCLQVPITKDEEPLIAQFIYKDERISFPRFFKLPKKLNSAGKEAVICQSLQRGFQPSSQLSYNEAVIDQKLVDGKNFRRIQINCRKKFKLLTYVDSSKEGISRFMEPSGEVVLTLDDCLNSFAQVENLVGQNLWYCNKCKEHKEATRHLELYKSNKILVIAFKRFNRQRKIRTPIKFPIESFNMGPYLLSNKSKAPILYDLYGVVNHYGTMGGGHYTAYCQNFLNKKWYEFNDSRVSQITRNDIVSGDSYVLFFRRKD